MRVHRLHRISRAEWIADAATNNAAGADDPDLAPIAKLPYFALAGPALLGSHLHVLWLWIALRQFEAVDAHCGYQLPWSPLHWLPGYDGAGYHDFHHAKYKGNYAGFFGHLDRWLGTQSPGFTAWAERRKG